MTDVYIGDSDFTTLVAGDDIDAEPLTLMFDRIKNFLKGDVADAKIKVSTVEATSLIVGAITASGAVSGVTTLGMSGDLTNSAGNIKLANTKGLQIKDSTGSYQTVVFMEANDNLNFRSHATSGSYYLGHSNASNTTGVCYMQSRGIVSQTWTGANSAFAGAVSGITTLGMSSNLTIGTGGIIQIKDAGGTARNVMQTQGANDDLIISTGTTAGSRSIIFQTEGATDLSLFNGSATFAGAVSGITTANIGSVSPLIAGKTLNLLNNAYIGGNSATLLMVDQATTANERVFAFNSNDGKFSMYSTTDTETTPKNFLVANKTTGGNAILNVDFGNATDNPAYNFLGTGATTFGGAVKVGAYTLPATDGTNGQVLVTNGSGVLTWTTL